MSPVWTRREPRRSRSGWNKCRDRHSQTARSRASKLRGTRYAYVFATTGHQSSGTTNRAQQHDERQEYAGKVISQTPYRIENVESLLTPALSIYPEIVDRNIAATVRLLGGDANRWRPHLKTAKLGFIMKRLASQGVVHAKCSTTVELAAACEAGMRDVLLAYAVVGANARRVIQVADRYPDVRISVLVENVEQV